MGLPVATEKFQEPEIIEEPIIVLRPSWLNYISNYFLAFVVIGFAIWADVLGAGIILALLILTVPVVSIYSNVYFITSYRVIERRGLIARRMAEADLEEIVLFNVYQSIIQRILGLGRIEMMSASDGGPDVVFSGICNPMQIKQTIWLLKRQRKPF